MRQKRWVIFKIANLLDLIENDENRPVINQIRGLLNLL